MGWLLNVRMRRIEKAWKMFHAGHREEAIRKVGRLVNSTQRVIKAEANRLVGLSLYKLKRYTLAIDNFEVAASLENSRHDWYNLAMALIKAGEVSRAEAAFSKINQGTSNHGYQHAITQVQMFFQYLRALRDEEHFTIAKKRLDELASMYGAMHKTDSSFLISRGFIPLEHLLKEAMTILPHLKLDNGCMRWFETLASRLDDEGRKKVQRAVRAMDA